MKKFVCLILSAIICLGTTIPTVTASTSFEDPLSKLDKSTYTRISYDKAEQWKFTSVNNVIPEHCFTNYAGIDCLQIKYSNIGKIWSWFSHTARDSVYYALPPHHTGGANTVNPNHRYAVITYATNTTEANDLCIHGFDGGNTVLESNISRSGGYWLATEPALIPDGTLQRINTPRYYIIWSDISNKNTELYVRDLVFFERLEDARAYSEAVPALLNGGTAPVIKERKYVEKVVSEINFDSMNDIGEAMIASKTEKGVRIADDINETNLRDPRERAVAGILSLESEGTNKYLRVSKRIHNASAISIPIASENALANGGEGKYILTFDMKAITTDKMYINRTLRKHEIPEGDSSIFFYESDFLSDKVAFRFGLKLGDKNLGEGGYIEGTPPGEICSLGALGKTDTELGSTSHPIGELDTWKTFHYEFDVNAPGSVTLRISGGNWPVRNADYAVDNIKLVCITEDIGEARTGSKVEGKPTDIKNEGYAIEGLVLNLDDSRFSEPNKANAAFLTKEDALTYIDQYIDCHITDLMLCVNTTFMSMYPSEVWDDQLDEYAMTGNEQAAVWHRYETLGIDPWKLWIDRLWEKDVNPWLSFRMNDHHAHTKDGVLTGDWFWENYAEYKRVKHRDDLIYRGDRCPDFNYEAVRSYWLAYIEEAVNKYDVYGVEFDWLRDPLFTALGNEMASMDMLTQFHRDIRDIVDKAELKWGHEIKIGVRCARDIQTNMEAGFDIVTWCAEGLVDVVIPSAYIVSDTEIPVLTWKKILKPYGVELYPNVTQGMITLNKADRSETITGYVSFVNYLSDNIEVMAGTAASYFAQGADKLYVYNVFGDSARPITTDQKVETDDIYPLSNNLVRWRMQTTIGSYAKVQSMTRRYLLTFQDYAGFFGTVDTQLPKSVKKAEKYAYIHFYTGDINDTDSVYLYLGMENNTVDYTNSLKVYVNCVPAVCVGRVGNNNHLLLGTHLYKFKVDPTVLDNSVTVEMTTTDDSKPYTVVYGELTVGEK